MARRRFILLAAAGSAAVVATSVLVRAAWRRGGLHWEPSTPAAAARYEAMTDLAFGGFFDRLAEDVALACPAGSVLEIGGGPGVLAERICRRAPAIELTGADIDPAMVERARQRAGKAGLQERATFQVASVEELPYPDASFDLVVSTFSMHHWSDPDAALAGIHRVLRPGGRALIYDFAFSRAFGAGGGTPVVVLAARSPFRDGWLTPVRWPGRLVLVRRLELVRRP